MHSSENTGFGPKWVRDRHSVWDKKSFDRQWVLSQTDEGYSDWRYASRAETEALLDSLWGGVAEQYDVTNRSFFTGHGDCRPLRHKKKDAKENQLGSAYRFQTPGVSYKRII